MPVSDRIVTENKKKMAVLIMIVEIIWELNFSVHYLDHGCKILEDPSKFTQEFIACVDYHLTALGKESEAGEINFFVYSHTKSGYILLNFFLFLLIVYGKVLFFREDKHVNEYEFFFFLRATNIKLMLSSKALVILTFKVSNRDRNCLFVC